MNFHVVDNLTVITTNTLVKYGKLLRDQHGLVGKQQKTCHIILLLDRSFLLSFFKDMVRINVL